MILSKDDEPLVSESAKHSLKLNEIPDYINNIDLKKDWVGIAKNIVV